MSPLGRLRAAAAALGAEDIAPPAPVDEAPSPLDAVRFAPERALLTGLFDRFGLEELLRHFEDSGHARSLHDLLLGTHLRLTPVLAPRLFGLFAEVRQALSFTEPVELFVRGDPELNASAFNAVGDGLPHAVALTSGAVERMTDDELRFVLGHELGHLQFRHYRAGLLHHVLTDEDGQSTMPPLLARRLETWDRLAELSADRVGFLATGERLDVAVSVFFKLTAGLGPEHLRFDLAAFLEQLADLQRMKRTELLATFSHPVTPVRVRALQLFGGRTSPQDPALEAEIAQVASLMELTVVEPDEVHARDLLVSAGLLSAWATGQQPTADQHALLVELLLPLASDPEELLGALRDPAEAEERLLASAAWLRENSGEERFELFDAVAHVVCVDGELVAEERAWLGDLAALLGIPAPAAADRVYEVLRGYLQQRAARERSRGF